MNSDKNFIFFSMLSLAIILSNYIAPLLNCNVQKFINNSMIIKHIIIILLIILTIEFNNTDDEFRKKDYISEIFIIVKTYIGLLLILKLNIYYLIPCIIVFVCQKFIKLYIERTTNTNTNTNINETQKVIELLDYILYIIIGAGNIHYFIKQYNQHKDFNILKYIFGTIKCKNV